MRILIVTATSMECAPVVARLNHAETRGPRLETYTHGAHEIDTLTSGIGMVATAAWCGRTLAQVPYELALNLGVCGSFDAALRPGDVVHVISDRIAELGVEDGDTFLTMKEIGLAADDECINTAPPRNPVLDALQAVRGITVNTVHGNERSIADVVKRFAPQIESMEGAAFMYACAAAGVPFAQIRAVSNVVERRNRPGWKLSAAIDAAAQTVLDFLAHA